MCFPLNNIKQLLKFSMLFNRFPCIGFHVYIYLHAHLFIQFDINILTGCRTGAIMLKVKNKKKLLENNRKPFSMKPSIRTIWQSVCINENQSRKFKKGKKNEKRSMCS